MADILRLLVPGLGSSRMNSEGVSRRIEIIIFPWAGAASPGDVVGEARLDPARLVGNAPLVSLHPPRSPASDMSCVSPTRPALKAPKSAAEPRVHTLSSLAETALRHRFPPG